MKILFLVAQSVLGGHVISSLTIARAMKKRGHEIVYGAPRGKITSVIEKEMRFFEINIPMFHKTRQTYFTWKSFPVIAQLKEFVAREQIEFIHAFDERSYIHAYPISLVTGVPLSCTLCGGVAPYHNIPVGRKIMSFSEEQKNKLVTIFGWKPQRIDVVRTRIDVDHILSTGVSNLHEIAPDLSSEPASPVIMMISTLNDTKMGSITSVLEAITLLLRQGQKLKFVLIGGGSSFDQIKAKVETINQDFGGKHIWLTGPVIDAHRFLSQADIVLGVGRSIFEGMVYGKPALVIGETGYAGTVSGEALDEIAYYNFSGRNQKTLCPPDVLARKLGALLSAPELRAKIGAFGKEFVMNEINVNKGVARIEEVYRINMERRPLFFLILQYLSFCKIMALLWWDNYYNTWGLSVKKALGLVRDNIE